MHHQAARTSLVQSEGIDRVQDSPCPDGGEGSSTPSQASYPLTNLRRLIHQTFASRLRPERTEDYDCSICLRLLYKPTTTSCGHSFCLPCLLQSLDNGDKCPLCRTVLFTSPTPYAISVKLNNIIQRNFPEEHEERKLEHYSSINLGDNVLPLLIKDFIFPCQNFQLYMSEPYHRLMVRRLMEGNRCMGMAGMIRIDSNTGSVARYACEVEIMKCSTLLNGRLYLEVESRRRCHIIRISEKDGYNVAEVEWIKDMCPPEGDERNRLLEMTERAAAFASGWIMDALAAARGDNKKVEHLFIAEGLRPPTTDPEQFSFWLATLTNCRPSEKLKILEIRNTSERIQLGLAYMEAEAK